MRDLFHFLHRIRDTLLFIALMLMALSLLYTGNEHHRARAISSSNAVAGTLYGWRNQVTEYTGLREVNARLAAENAAWRTRDAALRAGGDSSAARVDTTRQQRFTYVPAKVINATWHKPRNFLTLDKGRMDGLHDDLGVIGPDGIIGVVREVSARYASVISVLNPDVRTSVMVRRTGHFGLLYWDTGDPSTASVVDIPKHARVHANDTVVTMGGDGIFPAGIPVGVVLSVDAPPGRPDQAIVIRLFEDMARAGYVYVVTDLDRPERDSLQTAHGRP
jgi:rod shape-determining protein MreC